MGVFSKLFRSIHTAGKVKAAVDKMNNELQVEEFLQNALNGPVCCRVKILCMGSFVSTLELQLMQQGVSAGEALEILNKKLVGVCPDCRLQSAGKGLAVLESYRAMQEQGVNVDFGQGSEEVKRILRGNCRNKKCSSKSILLYWRPEATFDPAKEKLLDFTK